MNLQNKYLRYIGIVMLIISIPSLFIISILFQIFPELATPRGGLTCLLLITIICIGSNLLLVTANTELKNKIKELQK